MTDNEILDIIKRRMIFELDTVYNYSSPKMIQLTVSWRKDNDELEILYKSDKIETETDHVTDNNDY